MGELDSLKRKPNVYMQKTTRDIKQQSRSTPKRRSFEMEISIDFLVLMEMFSYE